MQTVTASILTAAALLVERPPPGPAPIDFDLRLGHQATRPTPVRAGHPVRSGDAAPGLEVATPATSASDTHSQSPPAKRGWRHVRASRKTVTAGFQVARFSLFKIRSGQNRGPARGLCGPCGNRAGWEVCPIAAIAPGGEAETAAPNHRSHQDFRWATAPSGCAHPAPFGYRPPLT